MANRFTEARTHVALILKCILAPMKEKGKEGVAEKQKGVTITRNAFIAYY